MSPGKRVRAVAAMLLATVVLAGCAGPAVEEPGDAGRGVTVLLGQLRGSWQQQETSDWFSGQVWSQIVDTLLYRDKDGSVEPYLARSWDVSPDGLRYSFHLRRGVTFSDGTRFDARVAADNLNLLGLGDKTRGIPRNANMPQSFRSATPVGDDTVEVTLETPGNGLPEALTGLTTGMLAESTINGSLEYQSDLANVVATGPYTVSSVDPEKQVVLRRRGDYDWPRAGAPHAGPAQIERLTFNALKEDGLRVRALEAGQADVIHYVEPTEEKRLAEAGYHLLYSKYLGAVYGLQLRLTADHVGDVRVRRAVQHGLDRQDLLTTLYNENWEPAHSIFQDNVEGTLDLSKEFAYDPALAGRLLDEAGWTGRDGDGYRTRDGRRLSLYVYPSVYITTSGTELQLVAQQLRKLGIELQIRGTDFNSYTTQTLSPKLPVYEIHWSMYSFTSLVSWWGSKKQNVFRAGNPTLDDLLAGIVAASSPEQLHPLLADLQRLLIDQAYFIPLHQIYETFATAPHVHGLDATGLGRLVFYDATLDARQGSDS
ncbi:ABC transporter substrate-binding protein [Nocardia sp. BMG51109]|uniref:ABC transporter substrate-binding protein n=1 Tax=Nocardia sp. BMG51109 TaxID=1056816 RepID=UPI0004677D54|nr:ABC transporter substrate-binding protein [Nocardia sp. BMG51109]